jgi:hypothetical protein
VSGSADGAIPLPEDMLSEEELNPGLARESALSGASEPYTSSSSLDDMNKVDSMASMGAFPDQDRAGSRPAEADSYDPPAAASSGWAGSSRDVDSPLNRYAAPSPMAELSQTREIISEWSVGARPDFSSVATVGTRQKNATLPSRMSSAYSSETAGGRTLGRWSHSASAGSSPVGGRPSSSSSSWGGGWSANPVGAGRSSSFQQWSDPVPNPGVPSSAYERSKPAISSGGYKPAWY